MGDLHLVTFRSGKREKTILQSTFTALPQTQSLEAITLCKQLWTGLKIML